MNYMKIGPTAYEVASQRAISDIKYAKAIFEEIRDYLDSATPEELEYLKESKTHNLAPMFEARYKLTDNIILGSSTQQILEIASGLSPRGMAFTDDPRFTFTETDLPEMITGKRAIVEKLVGERENLFLEEADALSLDSLLAASSHFKQAPIAIITEGLLRYLDLDQKAIVAKNIYTLLKKFGGFWVTPDIAIATQSHHAHTHGHEAGVLKLSGINLDKNKFRDTESGQAFMENIGFAVQRIPSLEVLNELTSPGVLHLSIEDVKTSLGGRETFVMRIR